MADPVPPPGDRELLAAELALGVLEGEARAQAERRLLHDPGFAEQVEAWRERLAAIALESGDVEPPAMLWDRVSAAVGDLASDDQVTLLRRRLNRWRAGAVGAAMLAAALAALLVLPPASLRSPAPPDAPVIVTAPAVVAQLRGEGDGPVVAARYDPGTARLRLIATDMGKSELVPELWVIPADGIPRSLGLIQPVGATELTIAQGHRAMMADGATLAVTMEPRAGAPHAAPGSPPVVSGKIFGI